MGLRLREELVVELGPDGNAIKDPLLVRTVTLGPTGVAVVPLLDGTRDAEAVIAELGDIAREKIEDTIRSFALLLLIEGIGDEVRARIGAIWSGEVELEYLSLPETRFACQASGQCCRSYRLGPITVAEQEAIEALPLREAMPDLPASMFVTRGDKLYLGTTKGAHCVFQRDNGLCGIHAHFGEAVKPLTCKFYPTGIMSTFAGERLYNNQHCASHFVAQAQGPELIESARLLRPKATGTPTLFHPIVFVRDDTPVDYSYFLYLEAALRGTLGAGAPFARLAAALGVIDSFVEEVRALPPGADPAPRLERWQASIDPVAPARAVAWGSVADLVAELVDELRAFLDGADDIENDDRNMAPLARELLPVLVHLHRRTLVCGGHHVQVDEQVEGAVASEEDVAAALGTSMSQVFYGRLGLPDDRPLIALGQIAIAIACGFVNAQQVAAAEGRAYGLLDLSRGHALANRVLPTFTTPYFRKDPDRARALVLALPALARWPQNAQE